MAVGFVPLRVFKGNLFCLIRDLNDGWIHSFMRFQLRSVLFHYEISTMVVFQKISEAKVSFDFLRGFFMMVVCFSLQDLNDGRFCSFVPLQDFKDVLFLYEISMMVDFGPLLDLNDNHF